MGCKYPVLIALLAAASLVLAEDADDVAVSDKATTIESLDFLTPPAGLDTTGLTIAATAPQVDVCFFAGLKDRGKGTLWSSWGDGCIAKSGKYYTSVGDHLGIDANCYVYEYDPMTRVLRRVVDVLRVIMQALGLYGHGKIHSGIHEAADGSLYFSTYWGKHREIDAAFEKGYVGSIVLRHDPKSGKTENLGAIVPKQGLPASHFDAGRQLLYFHAVYKGDITVFDLASRKVKFHGGADSSAANRTFFGDNHGRVYFSAPKGLSYYNPDKNAIETLEVRLPASTTGKKGEKGDTLRAAAQRPAKNGVVYGMTAAGRLFAFDPKTASVKDLGPNILQGDYTAVMAISPDDKYLYYAPGAHGSGTKHGASVVQYEIATGRRKVLAFLAGPLAAKLNWNIGGTYNLQLDPSGQRLMCTFNGAPVGTRGVFGKPALVVLHIPAGERS